MSYPPLWDERVEARVRERAENIDPQETPAEVVFCKRCVVSNQRPRITIDEDAVCSACRYAERKMGEGPEPIDWAERSDQLKELLDRFRSVTGYDVIVPGSGGKDSTASALAMKDRGMRPLVALWEPFIYTDIGRRNLDAFCHHGNFDIVKLQPAGLLHRKLARLAFEYYGDPFQPFVYGQLAWPIHVALQTGARLVMFGENGEAEYGGDQSANDKPFWDWSDWDRIYTKGASARRLIELGCSLSAFSETEAKQLSAYYSLPAKSLLQSHGIEVHWMGYYQRWHPQANYYLATGRTGFEANEERSEGTYSKYASIDDKLDGLHYYMAYIKFGLGRATSDAAHEVRDGDITREEAVSLVRRFDGEYPVKHAAVCRDYLGMDEEQERRVIDRFRGRMWDTVDGEAWHMRAGIWEETVDA